MRQRVAQWRRLGERFVADDADNAQDHIERENVGQLDRAKKPDGPVANGMCHWCEELIADHLRWCQGTHCRDLWTRAQEAWRRNHGSKA